MNFRKGGDIMSKLTNKTDKSDKSFQKGLRVITVASVIIALVSWIFNLGWYRVFLTWIPIPFAYTIAFLIINFKVIKRALEFTHLRKYILLSNATYLLSYLLFPDGGDIGGMYVFFGLIKNSIVAGIAMYAALILFVATVVILILECIALKECKELS